MKVGNGLLQRHKKLFAKRPVPIEALNELRELCTDDSCDQIECLAVKCALAYIDDKVEGRGMTNA